MGKLFEVLFLITSFLRYWSQIRFFWWAVFGQKKDFFVQFKAVLRETKKIVFSSNPGSFRKHPKQFRKYKEEEEKKRRKKS